MPALPPIPGVIRIQWNFTINEDLFAKCRRFYAYSGTAPTVGQANTFALLVNNQWNARLAGLFAPSRVLNDVKVTDMSSATGAVGESAINYAGTRAGHSLPASSSMLISGEVARRFRGGHPRDYWPAGVAEDLFDSQTWAAAIISAMGTAWNAYNSDIDGGGWSGAGSITPVNVSQYAGFTPHTGTTGRVRNVSTPRVSPIIDAVLSYLVRAGVASIRKRLLALA